MGFSAIRFTPLWRAIGSDQLSPVSDSPIRSRYQCGGRCIARQEKGLGEIAEQRCTNFVGRNRLDEKPSAQTLCFRFKHCVRGHARDGGDDIRPIGFRPQKQL